MYGALDRSRRRFGIRIAVGLAGACIAVFLFRVAFRTTERPRARARASRIPALACSFTVWSERPLMFGLALLGVLVFTVEVPDSFLGRHPRVVIPVVMWLWVNVHGTFALGFVYLACISSARWLDGAPPGQGRERDLLDRRPRSPRCVDVREPVRAEPRALPASRSMGRSSVLSNVAEWQSVDLHTPTGSAVTRSGSSSRVVALARSKPRRGDVLVTRRVPVPRLVGGAQRRDRGRGDDPDRRPGVAGPRPGRRPRPSATARRRRSWSCSCASSACC